MKKFLHQGQRKVHGVFGRIVAGNYNKKFDAFLPHIPYLLMINQKHAMRLK